MLLTILHKARRGGSARMRDNCPPKIVGTRRELIWRIAAEGPIPGVQMLKKILGNRR